jgi:hypothetical protein
LSDANKLMDAQLLVPLLSDLRGRLPQLPRTDSQLEQLLHQAILFDGSYFHAASSVSWALKRRRRGKGPGHDLYLFRLDLQLCAITGVPQGVQINGRGTGEAAALSSDLREGVIYIADRGVFSHVLLERIIGAESDFVLRIKTSQNFQAEQDLPRSDEALAAGVLSDRIGHLSGNTLQAGADVPVREVIIHDPGNPDKPIRLLTSLLEVDAAVIGELYRWRWQIELFFRWLKVHANFRYVYSQSRNGLTLAFYCAVIGVLLMYLYSGRRASKYAYSLLCAVAAGQATLEDILPILERRERENDLAKARLARKKAVQKSGI